MDGWEDYLGVEFGIIEVGVWRGGDEESEGGGEVFGGEICLAVLFGDEAGDFEEAAQGFGSPIS